MDDPAERQLAAYNAHDLDSFLSCFAETAVVAGPDGAAQMTGREEMRARYAPMFERGEVHAELRNRVRAGTWVVDHEYVTSPGMAIEVLVAYDITGDHITRMITLR